MITELQIEKLVNGHLKGSEFFLVEVLVRSGNRISVFIDGDQRVSVDTCRGLSRFLEEKFDRDTEDFELTVSSSGADRPLKLPRQYMKNTGSDLEIVLPDGTKFTGRVISATGQAVELERQTGSKKEKNLGTEVVMLTYNQIKTAKEVISFKK